MQEYDGQRVEALGLQARQRLLDLALVGGCFNGSVRKHALAYFDDARIKQFRLDDLLGEDVGARLVADRQCIAKPARDQQGGALALALQERVCGYGRAHLDRADAVRGDGLAGLDAEQVSDALHRGIAPGFGVFGQKLVRVQASIRVASDDVREGAAAIDPEVPLARVCHESLPLFPNVSHHADMFAALLYRR